jgi:hypothetical protein
MNNNNINNNDDGGSGGKALTPKEQRHKTINVLNQHEELPILTRNKIDTLVDNFLETIKRQIHEMLVDNEIHLINPDNGYCGLDADRDTEDEVETAIRFFPEVLSRQGRTWDNDDDDDDDDDDDEEGEVKYYPIQSMMHTNTLDGGLLFIRHNLKSLPFIVLLGRLGIELDQFSEEEKGGLLAKDVNGHNILMRLAIGFGRYTEDDLPDHQHLVNRLFVVVLQRLKDLNILEKGIVREYELHFLTYSNERGNHYACNLYSKDIFRIFIDWDPTILVCTTGITETLPLHYVAEYNTIGMIRSVFEAGIKYYPKKRGISLMFRKNHRCIGRTPFDYACERFGTEEVMMVIESTLVDYYSENNNNKNGSIISYNASDALLSAVIDENVHLDGIYFMLRRQPDILQKLLSSSSSLPLPLSTGPATTESDDDDTTDDGVLAVGKSTSTSKVNPKKRKRNEDNDNSSSNNKNPKT